MDRTTSVTSAFKNGSAFVEAEKVGLKGLKDFIESSKSTLKFVVSGKMGVGKSSLINGLLGQDVAKEDLSPRSVTPDITEYKLNIEAADDAIQKKVEVAFLDCPGLGDPLGDEEANLTAISEHCQDADLFIYCMDMRGRFTTADASGIKEFDQRVGSDIWKNTVFVLTFANEVLPSKSEGNEKFRVLLEQWEEILPSYFRDKMMLPEELTSDISVIPAGYGSNSPPPDRKEWFSQFWFTAFRKTKEAAQPSLLGINLHRFKVCSSDHDATKLMQQNLQNHELPIFIVAPTTVALGTGGGALLGALIGMAIGTVGGPVGMAVGAGIGAGLGGVSGAVGSATGLALITKLVQKHTEKAKRWLK